MAGTPVRAADPRRQLNGYLNLHVRRLRPGLEELFDAIAAAVTLDELVDAIQHRAPPALALERMYGRWAEWIRDRLLPELVRAMASGAGSLVNAGAIEKADGDDPDKPRHEPGLGADLDATIALLVAEWASLNTVQQQALLWLRANAEAKLAQLATSQRRTMTGLLERAVRENQYAAGEVAQAFQHLAPVTSSKAQALWKRYIAQRETGVAARAALRALADGVVQARLERAAALGENVLAEAWNRGALERVKRAIRTGEMSPDTIAVFLTVGDSRVCPLCRPMNGMERVPGDLFDNGLEGPGHWEGECPPVHVVGCRCVLAYRRPATIAERNAAA